MKKYTPLDTTSYMLPSHWAAALINDDTTGLTAADENALNVFLRTSKPGVCVGTLDDKVEFTAWHDAPDTVGACDAVEFVFQKV